MLFRCISTSAPHSGHAPLMIIEERVSSLFKKPTLRELKTKLDIVKYKMTILETTKTTYIIMVKVTTDGKRKMRFYFRISCTSNHRHTNINDKGKSI